MNFVSGPQARRITATAASKMAASPVFDKTQLMNSTFTCETLLLGGSTGCGKLSVVILVICPAGLEQLLMRSCLLNATIIQHND
jgi:hypothetical protein